MYGDMAMKEGVLKEIDLKNGTISSAEISGKPVIEQMVKENELRRVGNTEIQTSTRSKEPGLSMEMVRHFNHDIVAPNIFDPVDSILKASKYVDRSNDAISGSNGTIVCDPKLADFAKNLTIAAKRSDFKTMAKLLQGQFGGALSFSYVSEGGRPMARLAANKDVVNTFFETCNKSMWSNAASGFASRLKELDRRIAELDAAPADEASKTAKIEQLRADMVAFADMIKTEMLALESSHLEVPANIKQMQLELNAKIAAFLKRKGVRALSEDEMKQKKFIEEMIKSEKKPLHRIAMAAVADFASRNVDSMNRILDVIDDTLLGELRGESPEFEKLVLSIRQSRADAVKAKQTGAPPNFDIVKANIAAVIRSANSGLNEQLNASEARRGAMKVMSGVNLSQEVYAYYQAYSSQGYKGLATEYFKRRIPTGAVWDAYYQEKYLRVGVELVYLLFPPLAIPEGLYGMTETVADYGVGKWRDWQYADMVDKLYKTATFEDTPKVRLLVIKYDCSGKLIELNREQASKLPQQCAEVWRIIASQIKTHPVIATYEEMLANQTVSSGHDSIFPYTYNGLSPFGKNLQAAYRKQVDKVVEEYFKGVIEELEKRRQYETGDLYARVLEIGKEIGCSKPIVERGQLTRKQLEELIGQYDSMKKSNARIQAIKTRFNADFIDLIEPSCSPLSIKESALQAASLLGKLGEAVDRARNDVAQIIGQDDAQKLEIIRPATYCSLGMAAMPQAQYQSWLKRYGDELAKLRRKGISAKLLGPTSVCVGDKVQLQARYDRPNDKRTARWDFSDGPATSFSSTSVDAASWVAPKEGRYVVRLRFKESPEWTNELEAYMTIDVAPAVDFKIELSAADTTLSQNEIVPVQVRVISNRESDPVSRYFWSENGRRTSVSTDGEYNFSASGKTGKVTLSVTARTESQRSTEATLNFTVGNAKSDGLRVFILPPGATTISEGTVMPLSSSVLRQDYSGQLQYQWTVNGKVCSNQPTFSFDTKEYAGKTARVKLYVQQVQDTVLKAEGTAEKTISVRPEGSLSLILSSCPQSIELGKTLEVKVLEPSDESGNYRFSWYEWTGSGWSDNSYGSKRSYSLPARSEGQVLRLKVLVTDDKGRTATAETAPVKAVPAGIKGDTGSTDGTNKASGQKVPTATPPGAPDRARLKITAPDSVTTNEIFTVTAEIPADLVGKIGPIVFSGPANIVESSGNTAKMQFRQPIAQSPATEIREQLLARAELLGQPGGNVNVWGAKTVLVRSTSLQTPLPGNWKKTSDFEGIYLSRNEILLNRNTAHPNGSASVKAVITIRNKVDTGEAELLSELNSQPIRSVAKQRIEARPFAISDYKGYLRESPQLECQDKDFAMTEWLGHAFVLKNKSALSIKYQVVGTGKVYRYNREDPADRKNDLPVLKPESEQAVSEVKSILAGLKIGPNEETSKQKRSVKLSADKTSLLIGRTVSVSCRVDAGADAAEQLEYDWSGNHAGKGAQVDFMSSKPGKFTLTVTVRGKLGVIGSDSIEFTVTDFQPVIEEIPQSLLYGQTTDLRINLPEETNSKYSIAWQSDPPLLFEHPSTTTGRNKVTFTRMGKVKIWAQIKRSTSGDEQSSETKQISTTITAPKFKIDFVPASGAKLGQEVKALISETPSIQDALLNFKWESPPSSNRLEVAKNARTITFKLNAPTLALKAAAITSTGNEPVGDDITATYKATPYLVSVRLLESGVKPMVWDPARKGLVPLSKGTFAGDEKVVAEASIDGAVPQERISWSWKCNEGTSISNDSVKSPSLSRHETGTAEATVTARDAEGLALGSATVSFDVTVPAEKINKTEELKLGLAAERTLLKSGEVTLLVTTIRGGTAPYKLTWSPSLERKSDLTALFRAGKAGDYSVDVTVVDAKGMSTKSNIALKVERVPIALKVTSKRATLNPGESTILDAAVSGGIAPYTYLWSKNVESSGASGRFNAATPGNHAIAVEVSDTYGNKGSGSITINVIAPSPAKMDSSKNKPDGRPNVPALSMDQPEAHSSTQKKSQPQTTIAPPKPGVTNSTGSRISTISPAKETASKRSLPEKINAILENRDSRDIHLWSHGEVGPNAYNRVVPCASIKRSGLYIQSGLTNEPGVTFFAGRDGKEIATRKWSGDPYVPESGFLRVIWDGSKIIFVGEGGNASSNQSPAQNQRTSSEQMQGTFTGTVAGAGKLVLSVIGTRVNGTWTDTLNSADTIVTVTGNLTGNIDPSSGELSMIMVRSSSTVDNSLVRMGLGSQIVIKGEQYQEKLTGKFNGNGFQGTYFPSSGRTCSWNARR